MKINENDQFRKTLIIFNAIYDFYQYFNKSILAHTQSPLYILHLHLLFSQELAEMFNMHVKKAWWPKSH